MAEKATASPRHAGEVGELCREILQFCSAKNATDVSQLPPQGVDRAQQLSRQVAFQAERARRRNLFDG
jgi:hypothetical protein